jgi:hypothetical protein
MSATPMLMLWSRNGAAQARCEEAATVHRLGLTG